MKLFIPDKRDRGRWYCGPFAIAAITGMHFEIVRATINKVKGRAPNTGVCGMHYHEVRETLRHLGYDLDIRCEASVFKGTFAQWLKRPRHEDQIWLVELTTHYVIVQGDYFIDNHTNHKVHVAYAPWKRARVKKAAVAHRLNQMCA